MTDLDRYLTDDMIHVALRASDSANEGGVVGGRERMMRAALEAAAPLIAAKALEAARGPYRCCPHCADDLIHDVEKDDHTVPCQLCQNDVIRRAKAEAWDEGRSMSELTWRHIYDGHDCAEGEMCPSCGVPNPYRADEIEGDDS